MQCRCTSSGSCYLTPAMPASYIKGTTDVIAVLIDSKPARGRHGVGYVCENKCTAGTIVA